VGAYRDAVISLDRYLTEIGFPGGFEAVTVETLNDYFRSYHRRHSQGAAPTPSSATWPCSSPGWPTRLRHPEPVRRQALNRYAPGDTESSVLPDELIVALLKVTAGPTTSRAATTRSSGCFSPASTASR
jgi:hypothetical protein